MKKIFFLLLFLISSFLMQSQIININGVDTFLAVDSSDGLDSKLSPEDVRKIRLKKYLTEEFKPAIVGNDKSVFFLRYNIYEDQMEFVKDEKVYFLKKNKNSIIKFRNLNKVYKCYELNGKLNYFSMLLEDSKNVGLIVKEKVRFTKAQKAKTNYDQDKPANYRRLKDIHYFLLNEKVVEVPKKKKEFLSYFKFNKEKIKKYIKAKKLDFKESDDLKKILIFNNTIK